MDNYSGKDIGMFACVYNKETKKVQCQKFSNGFTQKNIHGVNSKNEYTFIHKLNNDYKNFDDKTKSFFNIIYWHIVHAYWAWVKEYECNHELSFEDKQAIREYTVSLRDFMKETYEGKYISKEMEFKNAIPSAYNNSNETTTEPVIAEEDNSVRSRIKMALMKNASNLQEFCNGNFYPIIKEDSIYVTIKNDNDEARTINKNRIQIVPVYVTAPC